MMRIVEKVNTADTPKNFIQYLDAYSPNFIIQNKLELVSQL